MLNHFDWVRIDAISVECCGFFEKGVDGLRGGNADQCADPSRMEFFHLIFQFLRLV